MTRPRACRGFPGALGVGLWVFVTGLALATPAHATSCGRPDLLDAVPPDAAKDVAPNASLSAHYDASAEYGNEDVVLTPAGGVDEVVKATWDGTQGLLTFAPDAPLAAGDYTLVWPALRGLNTGAPGLGATVRFTVGTVADVAPPAFGGVTSVAWDLERQSNDCTNSLENRMVFTLGLGPASDDGGRDGLTLVVFKSLPLSNESDAQQVLTTAMPAEGKAATVKLSVGEATGRVCFAALARDLTGKVSDSGSQMACVETTAPPFFRGCAVAGSDARGATALLALAGLVVLARRRRARAR